MSNKKLEFARGATIAGKYEVVDLISESPLGVTYQVRHQQGLYVRLTLLDPAIAGAGEKQAIINAFKLARATEHPNLLTVGELGDHQGIAYFTTEDFEGTTLRELINRHHTENRPFELREAAQIMNQILDGLARLHDAQHFLRGLRPEYVLINARRTGPKQQNFVAQVKLVGVGFWDLVPYATLAEDEFSRGEAQYLAPEIKSIEPKASPRSDLYSAGVMFYEMLVGQAPTGTFQHPRARRPDLPKHIDDVIELALATSPDDRYQGARDFLADIQRTFQEVAHDDGAARAGLPPSVLALGLVTVGAVALALYNFEPEDLSPLIEADNELRTRVAEALKSPPEAEHQKYAAEHMVYVPGGPFISGRLNSELEAPQTEPLAKLENLPAFLIDAFEFPNKPLGEPTYAVSWEEAKTQCESVGKRLCTASEWEKACKGSASKIYSYGDAYDESFCGEGLKDFYPSGKMPDCRNGWGTHDMSGNFREWTATSLSTDPGRYLVKGGLAGNPAKGTRCAFSTDLAATFEDRSLSFRCCRDLAGPAAPTPAPSAPADGAAPPADGAPATPGEGSAPADAAPATPPG